MTEDHVPVLTMYRGNDRILVANSQTTLDIYRAKGWSTTRPSQLRTAVRNATKENPMPETPTSTEKTKRKATGIRITMTPNELQDYYAYLGGQIGALRDGAAIRDQRPSEISKQIADWQMQQDRLGEALRRHSEE